MKSAICPIFARKRTRKCSIFSNYKYLKKLLKWVTAISVPANNYNIIHVASPKVHVIIVCSRTQCQRSGPRHAETGSSVWRTGQLLTHGMVRTDRIIHLVCSTYVIAWCAFIRKECQDSAVLGNEELWYLAWYTPQVDYQHSRALQGVIWFIDLYEYTALPWYTLL